MGQSVSPDKGTILIVEDEAIVRFHLADLFEDAGYRVREAPHAAAAIAILEADRSIGILLTDVDMPGDMDGVRLAHHVRDRYPPTVLLVMSGVATPSPAELPARTLFVAKPFDPHRLLDRIAQVTDRDSAGAQGGLL